MPYPAQVSRETLIATASALIEQHGLDHLTLGSLAAAFKIAAPSLYHHFQNKTALLRAVNQATALALTRALEDAITSATPDHALAAMFRAYRAFVHAHPATYSLLFTPTFPDLQLDPQVAEGLAQPRQQIMAERVGADRALAALRGAWALAHGFAMLEISGQFQRAGDLDAAYDTAITAYSVGLTSGHAPSSTQ